MSNSFILLTDRTLSVAITPDQSAPRSNDYEDVHHLPQSSRTGVSTSGHSLLTLYRDAVGVYYSPQLNGLLEILVRLNGESL